MNSATEKGNNVSGEFINMAGERFYAIRNVDQMAPFFISVVSNSDHWMFISSTGGLTAGRVSPENALFPYITVDKIHGCGTHTGSKTLLRVDVDGAPLEWEPFNMEHDGRYKTSRNLYKNTLGNKLCFEEVNHDLQLTFAYTWASSDSYGFTRQCTLSNQADSDAQIELVDGIQNILPAGTPLLAQTTKSNLVDAYKWNELDEATGLAFYTLFSGISDRAEPCESLQATTVFCLGLDNPAVLLSADQLEQFRLGKPLTRETRTRGIRGAYLVNTALQLAPGESRGWQIVADLERSQSQAVDLRKQLQDPAAVAQSIASSIDRGSDELGRIMARADGFQASAEETVSVHHYANVLFNILRGGAFDDQYRVSSRDLSNTIRMFNRDVFRRHREMFESLPELVDFKTLRADIEAQGDRQLERLASGELAMIVGTHALFQEQVQFNALELVIIDEQHRFGVHQRLALREKGAQGEYYPHQLIMTATPIPRTLAMTAYADLDTSVIDELPPGRTPVTTVAIPDTRRDEVIERVRQVCREQGRQAYWVCTLIDESDVLECQAAEETAAALSARLPELGTGLVHGRMKAAEKQAVMADFKDGKLDLLVATTVIEVGVDVPNASLRIIENPERLGLAQLHQLRGRVGRGATASHCVLLYHAPLSKTATQRLGVLRDTNDGFVIAQKDLEIRGPGELLGTRQTGLADLKIADLVRDQSLLPEVQRLARYLADRHPACIDPLIRRWLGTRNHYGKV